MRVFELAKKLKLNSKDLLRELKKMGIKAQNHMTSLQESDAKRVLGRLRKKSPEPESAPVKKKTRVLIKRKIVAPPPEEIPESLATVEKEGKKIEVEERVAEPVAGHVQAPPVVPPSSAPDREMVSPEQAQGLKSVPKPLETERPPEVISKEAEEKEKRKLLKTDLFELAKQELSTRYKERYKKVRRTKRSREQNWMNYRSGLGEEETGQDRLTKKSGAAAAIDEIAKPRKKAIKLSEGLTVKDFSELIGQKVSEVIKKIMEMGSMVTVNQPMDLEAATLIADSYGLNTEIIQEQTEDELLTEGEEEPNKQQSRPPVVTIMGHVDHGKTSLLDAVRETKVAAGEAGGITQHIGAYSVKVGDRTVVFLDTPGHEAFTAMRARGAKVTDIVVLVVAADDGLMPQAVEAINHARAADVPIVVAINKIDKHDANPERIKHALSEHNLIPEAWGGQNVFVEVSAKKRLNINSLLEMILLQTDVLELKANPDRLAKGVIVEAKMAKGRGPVATVLIENGTLRVGDNFVTGVFSGRVRALINDNGQKLMEAGPATPVEVIGLPGVPQAGDSFAAVKDEQTAREIAVSRHLKQRTQELALAKGARPVSLEEIYAQIQEESVKELKLIVRADVQGSVEALKESLEKLSTSAVKLKVIHNGVGAITETDIMLAKASNAIIIGFHVRPEPNAAVAAEREKVNIRYYSVIYNAINDVKAAMEGLLEPTLQERVLGRCEVREVFNISKIGTIAGVYITSGAIVRASTGARVIRDGVVVYEGKIGSLKRFKEDAREVQTGYECGVGIENFNDIKQGDIIEVYTFDEIGGKL
jgi:translation initiation factor IF-2